MPKEHRCRIVCLGNISQYSDSYRTIISDIPPINCLLLLWTISGSIGLLSLHCQCCEVEQEGACLCMLIFKGNWLTAHLNCWLRYIWILCFTGIEPWIAVRRIPRIFSLFRYSGSLRIIDSNLFLSSMLPLLSISWGYLFWEQKLENLEAQYVWGTKFLFCFLTCLECLKHCPQQLESTLFVSYR